MVNGRSSNWSHRYMNYFSHHLSKYVQPCFFKELKGQQKTFKKRPYHHYLKSQTHQSLLKVAVIFIRLSQLLVSLVLIFDTSCLQTMRQILLMTFGSLFIVIQRLITLAQVSEGTSLLDVFILQRVRQLLQECDLLFETSDGFFVSA